jgi:hypothetical protein
MLYESPATKLSSPIAGLSLRPSTHELRVTSHQSPITSHAVSPNNMRIKIIGENNCARATRHLLRLAGFAVTDFLPADAVTQGPSAGYAITIELAPATHTPNAHLRPDSPTQQQEASGSEEAGPIDRDASSPSFAETACAHMSSIHFDSAEGALEAAVLRHVTQLAAGPVIVDRPGGVVHSDRELRIVAPNTGDAQADEAAAVAIEFGVLRGLLDLIVPGAHAKPRWVNTGTSLLHGDAGDDAGKTAEKPQTGGKKRWWGFGIVLLAGALGILRGSSAAAPVEVVGRGTALVDTSAAFVTKTRRPPFRASQGKKPAPLKAASLRSGLLTPAGLLRGASAAGFATAEPQGQFATGQGFKITDGTNFFVVDPCKAAVKSYASINQTGNTQLVAGTASKKIYVCSIHVVAAAATNVAVVEGTGSVCATGTAGVSGFGGATAATGWNFAGNGGIALGNGDSSLGAEGASGDNLCIFNSGSGQVSGGISYVVE